MNLDDIEMEMRHYPGYLHLLTEAIEKLPLEIKCENGRAISAKYVSSSTPTIVFTAKGKIENIKIGKEIFPIESFKENGKRDLWFAYKPDDSDPFTT